MGIFGSSGRHTTRYPVEKFSPAAKKSIQNIRAGQGEYMKTGRKSVEATQEAAAAAGGRLPDYMYERARKGKLTKKG